MSTYNSIVDVAIAINTASSVRAGFGTPLFATAHREFEDRVRLYTSLDSVAEDFPVTSNAYKAAASCYSNQPAPTVIMIGRRETRTELLQPITPVENDVVSLTLDVDGATYPFSYTVQLADTEENVVDALVSDINDLIGSTGSNQVLASKTGAGSAAVLVIEDVDGFHKVVAEALIYSNLVAVESAASDIAKMVEANDEFYFYAADDHSEAYVTEAATDIQSRKKMYFYSVEYSNVAIAEALKESNFTRAVGIVHHEAETRFTEMAYVGANAPFGAGSVTWANLQIPGFGASQQSNGALLSSTQKNNCHGANANYIERDAGLNFTRTGVVASGEWIDTIRGVDWLESEIEARLRDLLVNQKGGKVTFTDAGINQVKSVLDSALQAGVNRQFLESYRSYVPRAADISFGEKASRHLSGVTFTGILAGAIHTVEVKGQVTYEQ